MSTSYKIKKDITLKDIESKCKNITIHRNHKHGQLLIDEYGNAVHYSTTTTDGFVWGFERFNTNNPDTIIETIEGAFECEIISEHDKGFFDEEELTELKETIINAKGENDE